MPPKDPSIINRRIPNLTDWQPGVIRAEHLQEGVRALRQLYVSPSPPRAVRRAFAGDDRFSGGGSGGTGEYTGPFACRMHPTATNAIEVGYRRSEPTVHDLITMGLVTAEKTIAETVTCTGSGYVYYACSRTSSTGPITASPSFSAALPGQSESEMVILLGYALMDSVTGTVTAWEQYQFGQITHFVNYPSSDC